MQRADLQNHWSGIQTDFVDEPRKAVEQADSLVASAMKRLAEVFAEERSRLEDQWDRGDTVSTEDLPIRSQETRWHRLGLINAQRPAQPRPAYVLADQWGINHTGPSHLKAGLN